MLGSGINLRFSVGGFIYIYILSFIDLANLLRNRVKIQNKNGIQSLITVSK